MCSRLPVAILNAIRKLWPEDESQKLTFLTFILGKCHYMNKKKFNFIDIIKVVCSH